MKKTPPPVALWAILIFPMALVITGASSCDDYFDGGDEPTPSVTPAGSPSPLPLPSVVPLPSPIPVVPSPAPSVGAVLGESAASV